jgi:hypothetical protein
VGTLRTSEEGTVVAGEGRKSTETIDEDRRVDEGAKIVITPGPMASAAQSGPIAAAPPVPRRTAIPAAPVTQKQGGLGLVIALYVLAGAALAYAVYERFFLH